MTDGTAAPAEAHLLSALRRFEGMSLSDAETLTGVVCTPATYGRLCEYDSLMDVHAAHERVTGDYKARAAARSRILKDHPEMYEVYLQAVMD